MTPGERRGFERALTRLGLNPFTNHTRLAQFATTGLLFTLGCGTDFEEHPSRLEEPLIVAVEASPAEVRPGTRVSLRAVVAGPNVNSEPLDGFRFAFCRSPLAFGSAGDINPDCFTGSRTTIDGDGPIVDALVPLDACRLFGPDPPPGDYRPMDPDETGGFYQPVLVTWHGAVTTFPLRLHCALPDASDDIERQLTQDYVVNSRPTQPTIAMGDGIVETPTGLRMERTSTTFRVSLDANSAETYVYYDSLRRKVSSRKEALRISVYSTLGDITPSVRRFSEDETNLVGDFAWNNVGEGKTAHLWVVVADSRGAMSTLSF